MIPPPYMVNLQWPISARLTCYNPTSRESSLTPNYTGGCIYRCVYMYTLWHTHTYIYTYTYIYNIDMHTIGWSPLLPLSFPRGFRSFSLRPSRSKSSLLWCMLWQPVTAVQLTRKERSRQFMSLTQQVKDSCGAVWIWGMPHFFVI